MTRDEQARCERRLLVFAPAVPDAAAIHDLVGPIGIPIHTAETEQEVVAEVQRGAAAVLIAEEAVAASADRLAEVLDHQPAWSDLPVLLLTQPGADSPDVRHAVEELGNVTLLERPLRTATLVSAIRTALRARERQYEIRAFVAERTRTEAALRQADRRKDEFLATLGHELRNPLSPLLTSLHLLKFAGPTDPIVGRTAAVMHRQLNYLVRLVDDLLEVSRITRGVIAVNMEPIELVTILALAIENSRSVVETSNQELVLDLPHEPMMIRGDAVRLTQAFSNLISNAARFTNPGGHIWITARHDNGRATVAVRDDGIGIATEHLAGIFEMFTQVDRSERRTQGGLGIGLTLVRSLVGIHGGSVTATSPGLGRGSTFEVRLPLIADRAVSHDELDVLRTFDGQRLLVVDDNLDAREMLGSLLSALGADVRTVPSGAEALEIIQEFRPDAVVLDIGLPGMDGHQVARRIRAIPGAEDIVLIAMTGWGQDDDLRRSRLAGFDHHLVKPPDINRLADILATSRRERRRA